MQTQENHTQNLPRFFFLRSLPAENQKFHHSFLILFFSMSFFKFEFSVLLGSTCCHFPGTDSLFILLLFRLLFQSNRLHMFPSTLCPVSQLIMQQWLWHFWCLPLCVYDCPTMALLQQVRIQFSKIPVFFKLFGHLICNTKTTGEIFWDPYILLIANLLYTPQWQEVFKVFNLVWSLIPICFWTLPDAWPKDVRALLKPSVSYLMNKHLSKVHCQDIKWVDSLQIVCCQIYFLILLAVSYMHPWFAFCQWHVSPVWSFNCIPQHKADHTSWISLVSAKSVMFPDNYKCICMPELRSHVGIPLIGHSCWAVTQFCIISQVTGEAYKNLCMMTKDRHHKGTFYVLLTVKFCLVNVVNEAERLFIISLSWGCLHQVR